MKVKIFLFTTLLSIMLSCNKNETEVSIPTTTNGNYIGIFERNGITSNVQLNLINGAFDGQSTVQKFPAICSGTYIIAGNTMTFENGCAWTAEFDWTLILSGEWNYTLNGTTLILTKSNGDKYTLTQQ